MADGEGEPDLGAKDDNKRRMPPELVQHLRKALRGLETRLREQAACEAATVSYCKRFCQTLLQYAGEQNSSKNTLHLLEVYRISIQYFARARPFLAPECEDVLMVLGKLVLSCFEMLLSVPESELNCEEWLLFQQTLQASHGALSGFGHTNLQSLVDATKEGGVWKSPVVVKILTQQKVEPEEVAELIAQEGASFLELRIKHLMKTNCIQQAMVLSKLCTESSKTSKADSFRQSYISCLCTMLPNEDAIKEISKVDCREVLDIICNLETEGHDNTAFILCTTYLTQQLQTENIDCSWELTLFWSKLQRRIEPSLESFLERCRQFGVIAKTLQHLFFLIRVVHAEAEEEGLPISILLCVRALQIKSDENDMKASVCKTVACLLPHDLEVRRACQLTEFLLDPNKDAYNILEALYLQPDQKFDEENAIVPNSLRCELLLALKAHWPFDPEFWDWKTLNRHCLKLLGKEVSESEPEEQEACSQSVANDSNILEPSLSDMEKVKEEHHLEQESVSSEANETKMKGPVGIKKPVGSSERYQRWLQYKFHCLICNRDVIEARILHHSKMHLIDGIYTCPVCIKKFKKKEVFVPHVMEHVKMPSRHRPRKKPVRKERIPRSKRERFSLMSCTSLDENNHPYEQPIDPSQYITFKQLEDYNLQDRDLYPCPGTGCSRIFKQFKYLAVHLKAEHQNNDENAKHYLDIKNRREKCGFCRRHFITDFHLHDHEQVHVGPQPYMCVSIDCFAKFGSVNELLNHKQAHAELQYKCELKGCNIIFGDLGQLYHHEAQHFRDASNACNFPGCKKFYFSKIEFENHLATHEIASTKAVNQVAHQLEELVTKPSENSQQTFQLHNKSGSIQTSDLDARIVLPPESTNSEMVSEVKMESDFNKNFHSESSQSTTSEKPVALLENPSIVSLRANHLPHSQSERHNSRTVSNVRPNKFFVSPRLREQFNIFSVTFDGKKFTCGFDGCGVSRKNTRGMHKHLRIDHPAHFKPKKRTGMNARNLLQLFSANQKTKRPRKLGVRQEQSEKRDTFKRRRLVCNTNSRRKHVLKGGLCRSTAHETAISVLPRVLSTEDVMLELLLGLKHLSLKNTSPDILSSTSLQKPISESFQSFPSVCSTSPNFSVDSTIFEQNISEQDAFTSQCIAQLATKPFYCELQGCKYSFVTKDALLVHYIKKHHYSKESVLQFSVFKDKFAPFQCHICQRAFTRRTHLSIHYRKKHQLAKMKLSQRLISARKRKENKSFPAPFETILNRNSSSCSVSAFRSTVDDLDDDDVDIFEQKMKHEMRRLNKGDYSSETDNDSQSEEMDSNSGEKPTFLLQDRHRDDLELIEGRGSKRTAKGDLCYILNKYHKPFHCVHKGCSSSFTNQSGLIRHYRLTHHYNKEQLCLEKDRAKSKSNYTKYKKIFVCKFQNCNKQFLGSKALGKHCRDIHNVYNGDDQRLLPVTQSARFSCDQPKCLAIFYTFDKLKHHQLEDHSTEIMQNKDIEIRCELNGCDRLFTHHNTYSKHVFYSHRECYDDIFGRPDELEGNILEGEESGVDKKPDLIRQKRHFHTNRKKIKKIDRRFGKRREKIETKGATKFRTREEAVNMCLEEVKHTQFPCMVHGCLSVVKLESSIVRHYKRSHFFSNGYIENHYQNLVLCVKYGAEEKGESHLEVHAKEYNMQRSNKRKMCLLENDFHYRDKENENYSNAVGSDLFNTESFLYKGMLKYKNSSNTACVGDHMSESSFCKVEQSYPGTKEKENKSRFSSFQVPLKRKKGCDERERGSAYAVGTKDNCQKQSLARTFDLKSFKPMGFESSFLKFIQEREHKDEYFEEQTEWEPEKYCAPSFLQNTGDMQNNFVDKKIKEVRIPKRLSESLLQRQVAACHSLTSSTETSTVPSLQNLRSILDKALTDCGDLALKQLHYLRPVVVLERSKFSTHLVNLFPAKKTSGLCVGSS